MAILGRPVIARLMKKRQRDSEMRTALHDYQVASRVDRYRRLRGGREELADRYRRKALAPPSDGDVIEGEVFDEEEYDRMRRAEREYRMEDDYDAPLDYFDEDGEF